MFVELSSKNLKGRLIRIAPMQRLVLSYCKHWRDTSQRASKLIISTVQKKTSFWKKCEERKTCAKYVTSDTFPYNLMCFRKLWLTYISIMFHEKFKFEQCLFFHCDLGPVYCMSQNAESCFLKVIEIIIFLINTNYY